MDRPPTDPPGPPKPPPSDPGDEGPGGFPPDETQILPPPEPQEPPAAGDSPDPARVWWWVIGGLVVAIAVVIWLLLMALFGDDATEEAAITTVTAPTTLTTSPTTVTTLATTTVATTAPPETTTTETTVPDTTVPETTVAETTTTTSTTTTTTTTPPETTVTTLPTREVVFSDGTHLVGDDIQPGIYESDDEVEPFGCYWERLSGLGGTLDEVIANGLTDHHEIVEVVETDEAFHVEGCGDWYQLEERPELLEAIPPGAWAVEFHIAPGRYRAEGGDACYWERLSGFSGEVDDVIANDLPTGQPIVDIDDDDAGFRSAGCGTWEPLG